MTPALKRHWLAVLAAPLVAAAIASAGCDIVTANLRAQESAEWLKTYQLDPKGRVDIGNVNGKIEVEAGSGNTVDVTAIKRARGASSDAARAALDRVTFTEDVSSSRVSIATKMPRNEGVMFGSGGVSVEYHVKVPAGAEVKVSTVNGGVDVRGLSGRVDAETTNGGVNATDVSGQLQASTTNGGLEIDLAKMPEGGVRLECTNGGIKVRLPRDARATISATIANGGISSGDLPIEAGGQNNRRRLEGRLNGGGPRLDIEGVNGGISLRSR
jgi:hypothetical protein